jgi:hypothetical protein
MPSLRDGVPSVSERTEHEKVQRDGHFGGAGAFFGLAEALVGAGTAVIGLDGVPIGPAEAPIYLRGVVCYPSEALRRFS